MARKLSCKSIDAKIRKTEDKSRKLKKEYDDTLADLKVLLDEKKKIQAEILLQTINKSGKAFDEVLKLISL